MTPHEPPSLQFNHHGPRARREGSTGDEKDSDAIKAFFTETDLDIFVYADLSADSGALGLANYIVQKFGNDEERALAASYSAFDYNSGY